jgi:hypothetical protein
MTEHSTEPARPERDGPWVTAGGVVVACVGALALAIVGAFLTPFRIGGILVPIALPLVVGGLAGLQWFAHAITRNLGLSLLPGLIWLVLSLVLSAPTSEGDIVLYQQNWVAVVYLLVGSVTIGVVAYRQIIPRRHR